MESFYEYLNSIVTVLVTMPVTVGEKFYFVYLLTFLGLAWFSYHLYYRQQSEGFLAFVFPRRIYLSRSAKIDYGIFLVNILLSPPLLLIGAGLQTWLSINVAEYLIAVNGGEPVLRGAWDTPTYLLFIVGFTLVADFSVYLVHRLHHQINVLWPIHALHHSATVMTPVTLFRKHPLWNVTARLANLSLTGLFQGVFVFCFFGGPETEILFGINTLYVLYNFFGANLRHSHIWLSWGKPLSYLLISPAMHQIHHDPERMNRNYGEVFALWDWLFGTLYIPAQREEFSIGLGGKQTPHDTLWRAYTVPLVESWHMLVRANRKHNRKDSGES